MSKKTENNKNACHKEFLPYLNRVNGQILGIKNMIESQRYCVDIIQQLTAAKSAIRSLELKILDKHISHCITEVFSKTNELEKQQKIQEICRLIKKIS